MKATFLADTSCPSHCGDLVSPPIAIIEFSMNLYGIVESPGYEHQSNHSSANVSLRNGDQSYFDLGYQSPVFARSRTGSNASVSVFHPNLSHDRWLHDDPVRHWGTVDTFEYSGCRWRSVT